MHQGYLSFLLDLSARGENRTVRDSIRREPAPSQRPANAFQWKIVVDVEGTVVVRGNAGTTYRVLGVATRTGDKLDRHRGLATTPNAFQWKLVEVAVREELARATDTLRAHPTWVEDVEVDDLVDATVDDVAITDEPFTDTAATRPRTARKRPTAMIAAASLAVAAAAAGAGYLFTKTTTPSPPPAPTPRAAIAHAHAPIDAPPTLEQRIASAPDFASALALARPAMDDSPAELSPGAKLVAHYASHQLRWADVAGAAETTIGHVLKDPEVERGKRLCATGLVQSIERRDLEQRKIYVGRLTTDDDDAIAFVAVGSTTDIVKRSKATICGAVIGRANGAVSLVGMFDLPENRAPIVESER